MKIISEIGINHNGDFRKMEELIRQSAIGGADYAKFQLYDSMRVFGDDHAKENEFTFDQVKQLKEMCEYYNIEFFASVFDEQKLEWCEELGVGLYKIASRTVTNEPDLCRRIIDLGKPCWVSLGFWDKEELPFDDKNVKYMNCISEYPVKYSSFRNFDYDDRVEGWSDHANGIGYALYNISRGAKVIEKHFTLGKGMEGPDHICSMDLKELQQLREYGDQLESIREYVK